MTAPARRPWHRSGRRVIRRPGRGPRPQQEDAGVELGAHHTGLLHGVPELQAAPTVTGGGTRGRGPR